MSVHLNFNVNTGFYPSPVCFGNPELAMEMRHMYGPPRGPHMSPNHFMLQQQTMMQERLMMAMERGSMSRESFPCCPMPLALQAAQMQQMAARQAAAESYGAPPPWTQFMEPHPSYTGDVREGPAFLPDEKASPYGQFQQLKEWSHRNGGEFGVNANSSPQQDQVTMNLYDRMLDGQVHVCGAEMKKCNPEQKQLLKSIHAETMEIRERAAQEGHPMDSAEWLALNQRLIVREAERGKLPPALGETSHQLLEMIEASRQASADGFIKEGIVPPRELQAFGSRSSFNPFRQENGITHERPFYAPPSQFRSEEPTEAPRHHRKEVADIPEEELIEEYGD